MNISNIKITICTLLGVMGSMIAQLFGGWTEDMVTLMIFMTVDFLMGLIVAGVFHKSDKSKTGALDSRAGWRGLCKKGVMLTFVLVAHRLDIMLNADYIRTTTIIGFIVNEGISIVENAGIMGAPLPDSVKKAIESLKGEKEDEDRDDII